MKIFILLVLICSFAIAGEVERDWTSKAYTSLPPRVQEFVRELNLPFEPPPAGRGRRSEESLTEEKTDDGIIVTKFNRPKVFSISFRDDAIFEYHNLNYDSLNFQNGTTKIKTEPSWEWEDIEKAIRPWINAARSPKASPKIAQGFFEKEFNDNYSDYGLTHWSVTWFNTFDEIPLYDEIGVVNIDENHGMVIFSNDQVTKECIGTSEKAEKWTFSEKDMPYNLDEKDIFGNNIKDVLSKVLPKRDGLTINENKIDGPKLWYANPIFIIPLESAGEKWNVTQDTCDYAYLAWEVTYIRQYVELPLFIDTITLWYSIEDRKLLGYSSMGYSIDRFKKAYDLK